MDALSVSIYMGTDDLKVRANKAFKQVARNVEGSHAAAEREAADQAIRDKTRATDLRLDKGGGCRAAQEATTTTRVP
jgi:hypothetical protein